MICDLCAKFGDIPSKTKKKAVLELFVSNVQKPGLKFKLNLNLTLQQKDNSNDKKNKHIKFKCAFALR